MTQQIMSVENEVRASAAVPVQESEEAEGESCGHDCMSVGSRIKDFLRGNAKYAVEYALLKHAALALFVLVILHSMAFKAFFSDRVGLFAWFFYLDFAVVSILIAIRHLSLQPRKLPCLVGMMIGMTFGMQTGMMLGTIIGATNGLVVGALAGMILGIFVGGYSGNCCGIMGVMEGMMAGVMGGTMGGMIGAMFSLDHILIFMPFFMFINVAIMAGLSLMVYEEIARKKARSDVVSGKWEFVCICIIVAAVLTLLIVYGPKTGVAGGLWK